ncbi:potassium channel family protein [Streptomyces subrutilus]|uniref:Two pore domain potassium channel family protein n=1 Tax=Streptomyces subrutilus TaxID=36818 RepID=A0A5P2UY01_9ACTN|nr:potassium channel family protein [Streptomyces subrutilus]QEU82364.1 two pore domain potassium channel family protein [Streptomyces subrutilus]WSJ28178.1 potassium channel family protein [Streptomyces subrutilus]
MDREPPGASGPWDRAGRVTRQDRRLLAGYLLRSAIVAALLTALYYVAPLDGGFGLRDIALLALGLAVFGLLVVRQVTAITRAEHPRLRALQAVATAVPLYLLLFSTTYYLYAKALPQSFSEPLSRTDALYFTMTVFATVGFGDIVPLTGDARALTTGQMAGNLIVVGVVAKALFGAAEAGMRRRRAALPPPEAHPPGDGDP